MGNLEMALTFVMALNVLMFLGQTAILDTNPDANVFFNQENSLIDQFDKGGEKILDTGNVIDQLPSGGGSISPTTGNLFTDVFSKIREWFLDSTGLKYLLGIVSAPYTILNAIGLPQAFIWAVGTLWYAITLFLIISFAVGR